MKDLYEAIRHLPHHQSAKHSPMSMHDRAAQFAPFSALSGYGEEIREAGRLTDDRAELDEYTKSVINTRLCILADAVADNPEVTVACFVPDRQKAGGSTVKVTGRVKKLRLFERELVFCHGDVVPLDDIVSLTGALFDD